MRANRPTISSKNLGHPSPSVRVTNSEDWKIMPCTIFFHSEVEKSIRAWELGSQKFLLSQPKVFSPNSAKNKFYQFTIHGYINTKYSMYVPCQNILNCEFSSNQMSSNLEISTSVAIKMPSQLVPVSLHFFFRTQITFLYTPSTP